MPKLDAHFFQSVLKQSQSLNAFRNVLSGLLEAFNRRDLFRYAGLHDPNMRDRGTNVGCHSCGPKLCSWSRNCRAALVKLR